MSHLLDHGPALGPAERTELARTAKDEAERLNLLVGNVLAMTRLEAGAMRATKEWQPLEEVVGAALGRMSAALDGRRVKVEDDDHVLAVEEDAENPEREQDRGDREIVAEADGHVVHAP